MSSWSIALTAFGCIASGVVAGLCLRGALPKTHINDDARDIVKLAAGLIGTLAALVLGLLISSAKSSFDTMNEGLKIGGARLITLDRVLARYGKETEPIRQELRQFVMTTLSMLWPSNANPSPSLSTLAELSGMDAIQDRCRDLIPQNEMQRSMQSQALQNCGELSQSRWVLFERAQSPLPLPFLVVLVLWLTILHLGFGLLAPSNTTILVVLLTCALSVSAAIFSILELNHPLDGIIRLSNAPLEKAWELLGK